MFKIPEVAEILTGFSFRKKIESDPNGTIKVIQVRDLRDQTEVNFDHLARVSDIRPKSHHFLRQGDTLVVAKGANNIAAHIDRTVSDTVAAANFLVLRVTTKKLLPEYLAWYLNQEPAQNFLKAHRKGSYIPSISKSSLSELKIPLPPLALQRKVVHLQRLLDREQHLIAQIQTKRRELVQASLLRTAQRGK